MENFKEFQGRDLDECIHEACAYFDAPREKLEVEIVQDAKSGIFGIVLARKAMIRARRAHLDDAVRDLLDSPGRPDEPKSAPARQAAHPANQGRKDKKSSPAHSEPRNRSKGAAARKAASGGAQSQKDMPRPAARQTDAESLPQAAASPATPPKSSQDDGELQENFASRPLTGLDQEKLQALAQEIVAALLKPIADHEVPLEVQIQPGVVRVRAGWQGDAGLLIGRDGQTLAAVQYLASRMISRAMDAAVRIQLDIGDYRSKQDERLRELARNLAEKARETGRSYSTRPLSSYHRRIIHLSLQDAPDILTRSSGDGSMKRVVISPRRASSQA